MFRPTRSVLEGEEYMNADSYSASGHPHIRWKTISSVFTTAPLGSWEIVVNEVIEAPGMEDTERLDVGDGDG